MTDEFESLRDALQSDAPTPDPEARQAALKLAMARFQEKSKAASQGTATQPRPISSDGMGPSAIWSAIMTALKPSNRNWAPVLAGGASLAVLTLAVLSTHSLRPDLFRPADEAPASAAKPRARIRRRLPMPCR
ncbi:hypothetical protein AUC68_13900 [Methyloceanibacter methanicus]|uniref:Uncharacterized protein n=1 Tax=Methyloceanibacter methanicus TaxID=1774968 RepID=A0A1E3W4H3_9HYPH|nr:hypothetical protein [Methyloceanibacter methanicus]ODS00684.1 hypothetical protein AUC68_13900 [Methyloceanibacter methanicus]